MNFIEIIHTKTKHRKVLNAIKIIAITLLCFICGMVSFSAYFTPEHALARSFSEYTTSEIAVFTDETLDVLIKENNAANLQELIDGYFCDNALNGNIETIVLGIIKNPFINVDFSNYILSLSVAANESVASDDKPFPTSLQKSIIVLNECLSYQLKGEAYNLNYYLSEDTLTYVFQNTIGTKGIMSYIYGLKLLESCQYSYDTTIASHTKEEIITILLEEQLEDGGFNLNPDEINGDVDVTAITLQALSPYYKALTKNKSLESDEVSETNKFFKPDEISESNDFFELDEVSASNDFFELDEISEPNDFFELDEISEPNKSSINKNKTPKNYNFTETENNSNKENINKALDFLKQNQLATGDYSSYGNACSESTSQVIIAINDLNLDYNEFSTLDSSILDGLLIYKLEDGSFTHTTNPPVSNKMASAQAFEALCSIVSNLSITDPTSTAVDSNITNTIAAAHDKSSQISIKKIIYIAIAFILVICIIVYVILFAKKKNKKHFLMQLLSAILIATIAFFIVNNLNIESRSSFENKESIIIADNSSAFNNNSSSQQAYSTININFSISCEVLANETNELEEPINTYIYSHNQLSITEGSTVFDVLVEICRLNNIQLDYSSDTVHGTAYIKSINSIYEFDYGDLSGWMYRVNGEFPSVGASYYKLKDGDTVEWLYTMDLGRDLEND